MYLDGIRVGVLDVNHGGLTIAESLNSMGYDAFAVDIYGTKKEYGSQAQVLKPEDVKDFGALISPVHMPPVELILRARENNLPVYTHHEAVGYILNSTGRLNGIKSIEVTGTYGKTTACTILGDMLSMSGEKVLMHTSRGLFYNGKDIGRLSITPANMITALNIVDNMGPDPSVCIFEVSLGGCGTADIGAITTLDRDYPIAGGTSRSGEAKLQMVRLAKPGSILVKDTAACIRSPVGTRTFGPGGDVSYATDGTVRYRLDTIDGTKAEGIIATDVKGDFDKASYNMPVLCAMTMALAYGVEKADIESSMAGFNGIEGRMRTCTLEGRTLIDNSNSGLTPEGVMRAIEISMAHRGKKVLVIGEEAYNVCDGLDPKGAMSIAKNAGVSEVVPVGNRFSGTGSLEEGIRAAIGITSPGDIIISCVKTWR